MDTIKSANRIFQDAEQLFRDLHARKETGMFNGSVGRALELDESISASIPELRDLFLMKVVFVTPAGRRRYMSLLTRYTARHRDIVVEHQLWRNTDDAEDIAWMNDLAEKDPFFRVVEPTWPLQGAFSIAPFFRRCVEPDTLYIRLDDDIVYLAPDAIQEMIKFRCGNPEPLLVFGNVINSCVVTHILQRLGRIPTVNGIAEYDCMGATGWRDPRFAEWMHRYFMELVKSESLELLTFLRWELMYAEHGRERVSINFISWLGSTFRSFGGIVAPDEEHDLNVDLPKRTLKNSVICGTAIAAHFAFYVQREYLDTTDILSLYEKLI